MEILEYGQKNEEQPTMRCRCGECESLLKVSAEDLMILFLPHVNFKNPHIYEYTYECPVCGKENRIKPSDMTYTMASAANSRYVEQITPAIDAICKLYNLYCDAANAKDEEREKKEREIVAERNKYRSILLANMEERSMAKQGRNLH